MIAAIFFYIFAAVLLVSAGLVVSARNPVHSVLFLILAFFNAAALFLLAGAEFLAMVLVIVYVGAVAVLFLFVVMMLDVNFDRVAGRLSALCAGWCRRSVHRSVRRVGSWYWAAGNSHRRWPGQSACRSSPAVKSSNTRGVGSPDHLHGLHLPVPVGRFDPDGRHDRRHRADASRDRGTPRNGRILVTKQNARTVSSDTLEVMVIGLVAGVNV